MNCDFVAHAPGPSRRAHEQAAKKHHHGPHPLPTKSQRLPPALLEVSPISSTGLPDSRQRLQRLKADLAIPAVAWIIRLRPFRAGVETKAGSIPGVGGRP